MNRRGFLGRALAALAAAVVAPPRTDRPDPAILRELDEMLGIVPEPAPVPMADINAIWRRVQAQLMPGFRSLNDEWAAMPVEYDPWDRDEMYPGDTALPQGREIRIPVDLHAANARTLEQVQAANEEMLRARALRRSIGGSN